MPHERPHEAPLPCYDERDCSCDRRVRCAKGSLCIHNTCWLAPCASRSTLLVPGECRRYGTAVPPAGGVPHTSCMAPRCYQHFADTRRSLGRARLAGRRAAPHVACLRHALGAAASGVNNWRRSKTSTDSTTDKPARPTRGGAVGCSNIILGRKCGSVPSWATQLTIFCCGTRISIHTAALGLVHALSRSARPRLRLSRTAAGQTE